MRFNPLNPGQPSAPRPQRLPKGTIPSPAVVGSAPVVTENEQKDGIELRFPQKPTDQVLALLRSTKDLPPDQRWHFHFTGRFWYARRNDATRAFAQSLITAAAPAPAANPVNPVDPVSDRILHVQFAAPEPPQAFPIGVRPVAVDGNSPLPAWRARLRRR